ncbi:TolC family protein [Paraburkholderia megapolitana]|nr:TolC family protein [Paraburkholderia megapolitana]
MDPLLTSSAVSPTAAASMLDGSDADICVFTAVSNPLKLQEAVERALCNNPKTREAWASVKVQAAAVGTGRAAFLPTVSGNWQGTRDNVTNNVKGYPQYGSHYQTNLQNASASLTWVLFDFGGRSAALRNANALLAAAQATQRATLETVFAAVAKDYYAAQAAQAAFVAAREVEQTAGDSFHVATARVDKGVAAVSDELQAQTSYAEAVVNRTKAETDWQGALGTLASDMDLRPDVPLTMPAVADGVAPDHEFDSSVAELIEEAQRTHPAVMAAQAQVDAARAKVEQTRAEGLPVLSLVGKYSYNNQPTSLQLGFPVFPANSHEWYLGFQVTIPIFEGFGRMYQVRQAQAQTELQLDTLDEARQQAGLDVWTSYQALQGATKNVTNSETLLDIAQRSYTAAQRRYQVGAGNILELLNAQSSLAGAKRQRIQALTDWRSARLQLAAHLGRLDMRDIKTAPQLSEQP